MDLLAFRSQVVEDLQALVPERTKVQSHQGRFDLNELQRYSVLAPCVLVAVLAATDLDLGQPHCNVELAAYLVTKRGRDATQDGGLLLLGSLLTSALRSGSSIGGPDAGAPLRLEFRNLYNTTVGEEGAGLGAVSWRQTVPLPTAPGNTALEDFERFYASFEIGQAQASPTGETRVIYPAV